MSEKRCTVCGKTLPADHAGDKCSLCAIGLTPSKAISLDIRRPEEPEEPEGVVAGRYLSGVICPECNAEFSLADVKRLSCSICGAEFTPKRMATLIRRAGMVKGRDSADYRDSSLGTKSWPEDTPLW